MNQFKAGFDLLYELQEEYRANENYEAALALDLIIDLYDNLLKGVSYQMGIERWLTALRASVENGFLTHNELEVYNFVSEMFSFTG